MPESDGDTTRKEPAAPENGGRIGPFRILEVLGEGGMGTVYCAEQLEPIRREVALKVIKVGMDTREVVARFENERQALAVMDHPNIAKVFDAGATESGRPYFVMELVRGMPITEYCDWHRLTVRERLELFLPVCQAVQHAHQKGVIHRDLKPSNILVTEQDGKPVAKVIDFGIAKAMGQRLTELTLHTNRDQIIGTPAYMSPEQADVGGLDIDTRTDIYSLGVILYELLVGKHPFEPEQLAGPGVVLVLREKQPPTPSRRFKSLERQQEALIADQRRTDPPRLIRRVRGDLDWITMRAMEKDRNRRYETATTLADDLRRHLDRQPVHARPPSAVYRARRFVQRHKLGVAAAVIAFLGLAGGGAAATVGFVRATEAEREARADNAALLAVSDFLVDLFEAASPTESEGEEITARELLDRGAEDVRGAFADQPEIRARLLVVMGEILREVGRYATADSLLREAVDLLEGGLVESDTLRYASLTQHALVLKELGDYDRAEQLLDEALTFVEADWADLPEAVRRHLRARVLYWRGSVDQSRRDLEGATAYFERALADLPHDEETREIRILATEGLGVIHLQRGDNERADSLLALALAAKRRMYGATNPNTAITLHNLGLANMRLERYERADSLLEAALAIGEKALGPDHIWVARVLSDLGYSLYSQGRLEESARYRQRALEIFEARLGPRHPHVAGVSANLGRNHFALGEYAEAERLFRKAERIWEERGEVPYPAGLTMYWHADVARATGRSEEALRLYRRAARVVEGTLGPDHPALAEIRESHAEMLRQLGRDAEADSLQALVASG